MNVGTRFFVLLKCHFYRATLGISAVLAVGRCLFVLPFATLVYSIETAKDITDGLFSSAW